MDTGRRAGEPLVRHTVSPHLTRLLIDAGTAAGLDRGQVMRLPGFDTLSVDPVRIPTATIMRTWEAVGGALMEVGGVARVMELWRPGTLGVWDYLFTAAGTLTDALRASGLHFAVIADPVDAIAVTRDGAGVTVSWDGPYRDHPSYPLIAEFVPSMFQTVASSGAGRPLTPVQVRLPHRAPLSHAALCELYGTRNVEFEAGAPSITFTEADAATPLPQSDPALAAILNDHARITVETARPVVSWLDRFHLALETAVGDGPPELARVAHRLAMGPRTLQRRLNEAGTSWREELERLRQRRVDQYLRETSLSVESIAARVGYSDPRALRRAIHRWYGHSPRTVRQNPD
ncbi:AraC family transcriptional regulator ligand-binding domain-containing protein [Actinomadura fulvescens]|uniref:AraC family transcriptional regulator n=1 Tax=Actinomadura fulvescens TaxID=46160 RepID=A0ABN3PNW8_9ACTN